MHKDSDKFNSNVIANRFTKNENSPAKCSDVFKSHSNPITKNLFKIVHSQLSSNESDYKSFSKFKPEDLR